MTYNEILQDIIYSIQNDYAGYKEKKIREKGNDLYFLKMCDQVVADNRMTDEMFLRLVNEYLASLRDRNLKFRLKESASYEPVCTGFHVRCYRDKLFVTEANQEKRVAAGDQILTMNQMSPAHHRQRMKTNILLASREERELWYPIILMSTTFLVKHTDGTDENLKVQRYPVSTKLPRLTGHLIGKDTLYLNLPHFADEDALDKLLAAKDRSLNRCRRLILDVRRNMGGMESCFIPLLDYVFPEKVRLQDLYDEKGVYTNYSERNCARKSEMMEAYLATAPEEMKPMAQEMIEEYREKSGSGLLWEDDEDLLEDDTVVGGKGQFEKVILLSDTYCEYAGETFVQLCKHSPIVTVVGRNTMGNLDYCNPVSVLYEDKFTFTYPMSKSKGAEEGRKLSDRGIPADQYLLWTPEECTKDLVLEKALSL